ncbi:hypothetical protein AMJ85_00770 [candidate division BRC1 bacterium SM23_51]|nr:MAG: hypothetical protein AMJ85_00770 [candidate division BRC1 bacterium SM23_51]
MDAFYASVEVLDNPSLRGKPVIVAGLTARGVVSAASYEARRFGVHSAMPTQQARVLCKNGVFVRPRIERYREVSRRIFDIIREFTDVVEPVSVDECYLDITHNKLEINSPVELAHQLKQRIRDELALTSSVGIAPNKFLAKIASDLKKPDGLVVVEPESVEAFLADLAVERIPGIGPVTQRKLHQLGIRKIAELRRLTREELERLFGKAGGRLYEYARGIDEQPVVTHRAPKSLSRERTFESDTTDLEQIRQTLRHHCESVARRLAARGLRAHAVEVKIRYDDFRLVTRTRHLDDIFDDAETIYRAALALLERTEAGRRPIRLVGVGVADLATHGEAEQLDFFQE